MNREHLLHVRQLLKPLGHNSLHCLKEIQSSNPPYLLKFLINIYQVWYHQNYLTLSRWRPLSYRNQSIDLQSKSMDCFLYDNGLPLERVNLIAYMLVPPQMNFATLFVVNRTTLKSWDVSLFYVHDCLKLFYPLYRFHNNSSYWKYQYFCLRQKFMKKTPPAAIEGFLMTLFD